MSLRFSFPALLLLAGVLVGADEKLVPAQMNPRTDAGGSVWDFQANGFVNNGSNDCFDNGAMLQINGRDFTASDRKQTADGSELVLTGKNDQIAIVRRILVDGKRSAARYLEVLTNTGKQKLQVIVEVRSNLGSQATQSAWNDGRLVNSGPLPKKCVALAAIPRPGDSRPGVIWVIGETAAATPPTVEVSNQHSYAVRYTFELAPQQTRVVLHYVLQRPGLQVAQIAEIIKPLWRSALVKPVVPPAYKKLLVNFRSGAPAGEDASEPPLLPVIAALLERAGVEDTEGKALVGVGRSEAERMSGSLSGGPLIATTEFGAVTIDLAEVAGSEGSGFRTLLHLRSGETIVTAALSGSLRLETEAGVELPVDPAQVAWLVAKRGRTDGATQADQLGVLLLSDGSRVALSNAATALPVISSYGQATVAFDQLVRIERVNEPPGWLASMRDGSRLRILPATREIEVPTCRHGVQRLLTARIIGYLRQGASMAEDDEREDGAHLDNGERFLGGLAGPTLTIQTNGADTAIPVERITAIERPEDSNGLAVVLRDGGRLVGSSGDGTVAFLAGGQSWRVPTTRLVSWQAAKPPEPVEAAAEEKPDATTKPPASPLPAGDEQELKEDPEEQEVEAIDVEAKP